MTSASNVTSPDPWDDLTATQRLSKEGHILDVTVWLMIFCIFTFFFIIIVASICMHWMEVRRCHLKGGAVLLPPGPVPACVTVLAANQPHLRLIDHYHLHPCYGASYSQIIRSQSSPSVCKYTNGVISST